MKALLTVLFILLFSLKGFSQIEELIEEPEHFVNIYKDARLDLLDKRPALMAKAELDEKAALKAREAKISEEKAIPLYKPIVSADGKKKVTGSITSAKGFRVIIYNGGDRDKAMLVKNAFARAYPGTRSYMSYNVPSYKIKVGDFQSRKEASDFLRKVNGSFPASFIVPDIVTVKNINVSN